MISICQSSNCGMLTADRIYPVKYNPPLRTSSSTNGWTIYEWQGTQYWDYPRSPSLCWVSIQIDNTCDEKTSETSEKMSQVDADLFTPGTCVLLILLIFFEYFWNFWIKALHSHLCWTCYCYRKTDCDPSNNKNTGQKDVIRQKWIPFLHPGFRHRLWGENEYRRNSLPQLVGQKYCKTVFLWVIYLFSYYFSDATICKYTQIQ